MSDDSRQHSWWFSDSISVSTAVMSFSIFSELESWYYQVKSILLFRWNHLTPNDYTIMLVLCICIGYCLLRNRN